MKRTLFALRRPRNAIVTALVAVAALGWLFVSVGRGSVPDLPTAEVVRGEFTDLLEIRGEIRPVRSVVLASPMQSGELQIIKLAKSGTMVKPGDVVVQFDGSTLLRTIQEKQSELRQADAEIEQQRAQSKITEEQNATALMRAQYDLQRAKLEVTKGDTIPRIQLEQAKLAVGDAEQKLKELAAKIISDKTAAEASVAARRRKREKALADLERAQRGLQKLEMTAPAAGMVNVLPNPRSGGFFGGNEQEFREGDRAWAGASVLELPDLSSVHLEARLDESDRGRLNPGQDAMVKIEAVPGKDFKARIDKISLLARVDFSSGWPPPKNFDLGLVLLEIDPRIRPGMTAVARIATDRVPDVVLVPSEAVFQKDGSPVLYVLDGSMFTEQRVQISRRGKEQSVVAAGIEPGARVALRRPSADLIRRSP
ncbi:MAG TPA: efflux RND transporter periplasmic adaptor subunit [Vicinamibacterales bacterium]|nr:efflux RND transporter periplasmic adaptor subunit [Vicinamibacterales bacterium]